MSRKTRKGRRLRRFRNMELRRSVLENGPSAPARVVFSGRARRGDAASLEIDLRRGAVIPFNPDTDDPESVGKTLGVMVHTRSRKASN